MTSKECAAAKYQWSDKLMMVRRLTVDGRRVTTTTNHHKTTTMRNCIKCFTALLISIQLGRIWSFMPVNKIVNPIRLQSVDQDDEPKISVSSEIELWLDLRRSSVAPQAALMHLCNDLWDEYVVPENKSFLVDKVVMNHKNDLSSVIQDVNEEFEDKIGMIVSNDDQLFQVQQEVVSQSSMGRVFSVSENEKGVVNLNENPLPILETITDGKWSIIEDETGGTENTKSAIRNIVELASNGLGGLGSSNSSRGSGGIAVSCNSVSDVLNMCALVESLGGSFSETDSGILVKSDNMRSSKIDCLKYAILIPFDASLWKTASFVFQ